MKKVLVSFVSAIALASASMAMAGGMTSMAASDDQASNASGAGIFVSGNLGLGSISNGYKDSDFVGTESHSYRNYGFAWAANLGYMFNQYVGLEAGYQTFGEAKATFTPFAGASAITGTTTFGGFDAAVKGVLPVSSAFDVFGKVGAIDMHASTTGSLGGLGTISGHTSTWMPLIGAGVAYNINSNTALTLQDDYAIKTNYKVNGNNVTMPGANDVLAGVTYKFNL